MRHIVFSGQLGAGKDEIANITASILGKPWTRSAFADPVKDIYCRTFSVDRDFIEKHKRSDVPPEGFSQTVRKSLQFIGDGFRQIKPSIWIDLALNRTEPTIFSDGRYTNEAKAIGLNNGFSVLVWRPGFENNDSNSSESQIVPIITWCVSTGQNGLIKKDMIPKSMPEIGYYHYFFRNNTRIEDLSSKIKNELMPSITFE